ncbi:hypothetical protein ACMU_06665 [Actibacterium mucosum KCTC 23349]|uniref:Peptidase M10 serralysin C-terminal domain-containing protein n=1 Tax=Actibacterium mucosum KCTC 23349 TaxID=1454373 RepID=A0A037ZJK4_9RHOB|nr:M10 family metallopeptidase C-terminal domain-containing protein [Actibacterium mucosum]KAJ56620.1 hypothetical protein ACMU_06665 [Actibacterium mucosum KCTC 23349]
MQENEPPENMASLWDMAKNMVSYRSDGYWQDIGADNLFYNDSNLLSVLSGFNKGSTPLTEGFKQNGSATLAPADLLALQMLYADQGVDLGNVYTGDTVYGFNTNIQDGLMSMIPGFVGSLAFSIVDSGGIDTLDFSGFLANQLIDLTVTKATDTAPSTSNIGGDVGNMTLAVGTIIENAIDGSGNDTIIGDEFANTLAGGSGGVNELFGMAGNDLLLGGGGLSHKFLHGGDGNDILIGGNTIGHDTLIGGAGVRHPDRGSGQRPLHWRGRGD